MILKDAVFDVLRRRTTGDKNWPQERGLFCVFNEVCRNMEISGSFKEIVDHCEYDDYNYWNFSFYALYEKDSNYGPKTAVNRT